MRLNSDADDQPLLINTHTHVAIEHPALAAEHLFGLQLTGQGFKKTFDEAGITVHLIQACPSFRKLPVSLENSEGAGNL